MIKPKTVADYGLLRQVWGTDKIDFDALDRMDDKQIAYLYYELEDYRAWVSVGEIHRFTVIENNVLSLIRVRFLRSQLS